MYDEEDLILVSSSESSPTLPAIVLSPNRPQPSPLDTQSYFQEESIMPVIELSRVNNSVKRTREEISQEEAMDSCSICHEPWSNSGPHHIVSTKCGHLFGKNCIVTWLNSPNNSHGKCPICMQKVSRSDIRPIYAPRLVIQDEIACEALRTEAKRFKEQAERNKSECDSYKQSFRKAEAQVNLLEIKLRNAQYTNASHHPNTEYSLPQFNTGQNHSIPCFIVDRKFKLSNSPDTPTRNLAYIQEIDTLLVGKQNESDSHGIMALPSLSNPSKSRQTFSSGHTAQVKNIKYFRTPNGEIYSLSVGLDRKLILQQLFKKPSKRSIKSTIKYEYTLPTKLWCCCFDSKTHTKFYAGGPSGKIYIFDLNINIDGPVKTLDLPATINCPILFMDLLPREDYMMLVTLKGIYTIMFTQDDHQVSTIEDFSLEGLGVFAASRIQNGLFLFSIRSLVRPYTKHIVGKFEYTEVTQIGSRIQVRNSFSNTENQYRLRVIEEYPDEISQANMTQTCALQSPTNAGMYYIAYPGSNDKNVIVCQMLEGQSSLEKIETPSDETVNHISFIEFQDREEESIFIDEFGDEPFASDEEESDSESVDYDCPDKSLTNYRLAILTNQHFYLYKFHSRR